MQAEAHGGVLFVHAHPDDESMGTGGTIARLVAEGVRVDLVTCTDGAEGEIHDPTLDHDEARPRRPPSVRRSSPARWMRSAAVPSTTTCSATGTPG